MINLLIKMFLVREIKNRDGELYFQRWRILETKWFNLYLHVIYKSDSDKHYHNHPWNFYSFTLWNKFYEETQTNQDFNSITANYKRFRYTPLAIYHKLTLKNTPAITLILTGPRVKEDWGYSVRGNHIPQEEYHLMKKEGLFDNEK